MTGTAKNCTATIDCSMTVCRDGSRMWLSPRLAARLILATSVWIGVVDRNRAAAEEILFSSIAGSSSGSISMGTSEPEYWRYAAQQFQTTWFNKLTKLTMRLGNFGAEGTFNVLLYSNGTGNVPGSPIQTLISNYTAASILPEEALQNIDFTINASLLQNQNYWVVIDAGNVTAGNLQWGLTKNSSGTGVSGRQTLRNSDDLGAGWSTNFPSDYGRMTVVAVPEQGTLPLAGIGLLGAGWAVRRMKRRESASAGA